MNAFPAGQKAFGVSLKDIVAAGASPVVLQDCLRWLALRGLTTPRLFQTPVADDKRKLLALRHLYDTGRRPLRSKSCRDKNPHLIANLLLTWLGALPEPLFPPALVPALVESQQSDYYEERVASMRALLKQAEPFVVEALFPLFELLHHYWINQADRDATLQRLGGLLAPAVFGTPLQHGLPPEDGGLLSDAAEMLISEYRPLFTQPFNLRRYEADAARQAAAEAQRAEAAAVAAAAAPCSSPPGLAGPLLTPIRCERLSVMAPEGASPFSDCCGTPLPPESPCSALVAGDGDAALLGTSPPLGTAGWAPFGASPPPAGFRFVPTAELGSPCAYSTGGPPSAGDDRLDQTFSDLLDCTVSGMLFDVPLTPGRDGADAARVPTGAGRGSAALLAASCGDQPMSPTAVLAGEGCDSADGSDCDAPMAAQHPFAWQPAAGCTLPSAC